MKTTKWGNHKEVGKLGSIAEATPGHLNLEVSQRSATELKAFSYTDKSTIGLHSLLVLSSKPHPVLLGDHSVFWGHSQ